MLDKNVIWLGAKEGECLRGHKPVKEYLERLCFPEASVAGQKYTIIIGNERLCGLAGTFFLSAAGRKKEIWNGTILWRRTEEGPKAAYVHLSKYDVDDKGKERYWFLDRSGRNHCLREQDIIYVEASGNYMIIHCMDKKIAVLETMLTMEQMLSDSFLRVHRSYLINKEYVLETGRCFVKMINGDEIQIPVKRYCKVRSMLERV